MPVTGTDAYTLWFWIQNMKHLRLYTQAGVVTDPDLHEDLRELDYEAADAALARLVEQLETLASALHQIVTKDDDAATRIARRALQDVGAYPARRPT